MPDGRASLLFTHDSQALLTAGIEPSASSRAATSSAAGSQTENGSVTVSVPAIEPDDDQDQAWDTSVTPTRPSAAPSVRMRLLLRFPIYLPTFEAERMAAVTCALRLPDAQATGRFHGCPWM